MGQATRKPEWIQVNLHDGERERNREYSQKVKIRLSHDPSVKTLRTIGETTHHQCRPVEITRSLGREGKKEKRQDMLDFLAHRKADIYHKIS